MVKNVIRSRFENESVLFHKPAPLRRLDRGLCLTSHQKEGIINSENKLYELVWHCLNELLSGIEL